MRVLKKMSFDALMGNVSREEMKSVLAGSGEVLNGSGYTQSQGGGGGYNNFANAMTIAFQPVSSFYTGLQSTNIPGTAMYVPQQSYNSSNGWGNVAAAVNQYNYNNNYSTATNNSSSNNLGWVAATNGNIKTTDPTAISRMMGLVDLNILNNRSPGYGLNDFVQNETSVAGRAENDAIYGAIALNNVTVYNNYRKPQGMNYQNGNLSLDMGVIMGSGSMLMGSGGGYQVQTVTIKSVPGPTDCVFRCLGWISAMYGDQTHDSNYYSKSYDFTHPSSGTNVLYNYLTGSTSGGVPQNELLKFASTFFNATDYSGASTQFLTNFINPTTNPSGDNQLIGVYRNPSGGLHAVTITSIEGNRVNYYDPQNNISSYVDRSKMESFIGIKAK